VAPPAVTESEVAVAILDGKADAGIALRAVCALFPPGFDPVAPGALRSRDPPPRLFRAAGTETAGLARSADFAEKAAVRGGYDVGRVGGVRYNA
jgi:putative molybdopterin biosynthesis protein